MMMMMMMVIVKTTKILWTLLPETATVLKHVRLCRKNRLICCFGWTRWWCHESQLTANEMKPVCRSANDRDGFFGRHHPHDVVEAALCCTCRTWTRGWVLQKRLNWSRCSLGQTWVGPRVRIPYWNGHFWWEHVTGRCNVPPHDCIAHCLPD